MAERFQIYKCELCGNIIEVLHGGAGELVCCGEAMKLLDEQTADQSTEKHVPVIEKSADGVVVKVGSVPHPMQDAHYIEFIEVQTDGGIQRAFLKPSDAPEAAFKVDESAISKAREFCNVHGLWKFEK
jgi:superoxide reductase